MDNIPKMGDIPKSNDILNLRLFCKRCGNKDLDLKKLFTDGILRCNVCNKTRIFLLNGTDIIPRTQTIKVIDKKTFIYMLEGAWFAELKTAQETDILTSEQVPIEALNMILQGLISDDTIFTDSKVKSIYNVLSHAIRFDMLVQLYIKLNSKSLPTEAKELTDEAKKIITELEESGIKIAPEGVVTLEKEFTPDQKEKIADLKNAL